MTFLQIEIEEPITPVPSPEEARFRRLVSTISICFYFRGPTAALLQESPFVAQMALAVAMVARVAVGRRVLPALVDGGHLPFVSRVVLPACAFCCSSLLAQHQPRGRGCVVVGYQ